MCLAQARGMDEEDISVAVLAEIPLRSPRFLFILIIEKIFTGSKCPKK